MTVRRHEYVGRMVAASLVAVVIALAVITLVMYVTEEDTNGSHPVSPRPTTPAAETAVQDRNDLDNTERQATDADEASWEPVVLGFAEHFPVTSQGDGMSARRWRAGLRPFVNNAVAAQLNEVDFAKVPRGHYESYEVLTPGSFQIAVKVDYREGWALVLYVTSDGSRWKVSAYDRWIE